MAHLGYFRSDYVKRRGWCSDAEYAEIVSLGQVLPGPTSSQVGFGIGLRRSGLPGGLGSWVGFTLPSAVLMAGAAALGSQSVIGSPAWLQAFKLVAVVAVTDAVIGMATRLTTTIATVAIAAGVFVAVSLIPGSWVQVVVILVSGGVGALLLRSERGTASTPQAGPETPSAGANGALDHRVSIAAGGIFAALLVLLPLIASSGPLADLVWSMYRAGSLVFGGGHVVLPLLAADLVPGSVEESAFLAGYGLAQAVPGPLFTFASYLGWLVGGPVGAVVATVAIFAPGLLLMVAVAPVWGRMQANPRLGATFAGVGAGVVGLLAAALVDPVISTSVTSWRHAVLVLALFLVWRRSSPLLAVLTAVLLSPLLVV